MQLANHTENLLYYNKCVSSVCIFVKHQIALTKQSSQPVHRDKVLVTSVLLAVSGWLAQEIQRFHNFFVYMLPLRHFQSPSHFSSLCLSPLTSLSPSNSPHGMCLTDSGSALMALHSASGTSTSTFFPVHHHLPPHLCIKYQVQWKRIGCQGLSSLGGSEGKFFSI